MIELEVVERFETGDTIFRVKGFVESGNPDVPVDYDHTWMASNGWRFVPSYVVAIDRLEKVFFANTKPSARGSFGLRLPSPLLDEFVEALEEFNSRLHPMESEFFEEVV